RGDPRVAARAGPGQRRGCGPTDLAIPVRPCLDGRHSCADLRGIRGGDGLDQSRPNRGHDRGWCARDSGGNGLLARTSVGHPPGPGDGPDRDMTAKRKPVARLDPVIHPITRLSICGLLASGADWVEFAALRDAAGISDSVLSKQSRALEDAGYVE